MIDLIKKYFGKANTAGSQAADPHSGHDLRVAVCALCIEMARIDGNFSAQELDHVLAILKQKYHLAPENVEALMDTAEQELDESVDLWQFAKLINENYTIAEKIEIIEILWKIVYVDGKMDEHEHYLMNKMSNLLRLSHPQLIDAKLKVLRSNKTE